MCGIKSLIILAMTAFYFSIMPWSVRTNELVSDIVQSQMALKEGWFVPVSRKAVGKLRSVIRLYTLDLEGKSFDEMVCKHGGRVGAVLFKGFDKTPARVFINGVLIELLASRLVNQADRGNELHIDLDALTQQRAVARLMFFTYYKGFS